MKVEHIVALEGKKVIETNTPAVKRVDIKNVGDEKLVVIDKHYSIIISTKEGFPLLTIVRDYAQICRMTLFSYNAQQHQQVLDYIASNDAPGEKLIFEPPTNDHFIFSVNLVMFGVTNLALSKIESFEHTLFSILALRQKQRS